MVQRVGGDEGGCYQYVVETPAVSLALLWRHAK